MAVRLREVAKKVAGAGVDHLGEQAKVIRLGHDLFEICRGSVHLAGVQEVSNEPEAQQDERALVLERTLHVHLAGLAADAMSPISP